MTTERELPELKELFERSATTADAVTLERLERSAADVARRGPQSARTRWWIPVLAAAAAFGGLYVSAPAGEPSGESPKAADLVTNTAPATTSATPLTTAHSANRSDEPEPLGEDDEGVNVLDDLALEPGDLSDAELDAWISVAGSSRGG